MRAIFISYRHEDTGGEAERLFNDLAQRFGEARVAMQVSQCATSDGSLDSARSLAAIGVEPVEGPLLAMDEHVEECAVLLVLIGKGWLDARDARGLRRLDDPLDLVRLELAAALRRDIPLVPLLLQGAHMPHPEELPAELGELAFRNAIEIRDAHRESEVAVLARVLSRYVPLMDLNFEHEAGSESHGRWLAPTTVALGLIAVGLGGLAYGINQREPPHIETALAPLAADARARPGAPASLPSSASSAAMGLTANVSAPDETPTPALPLFNYWSEARAGHLLSTTPEWSGSIDGARLAPADYRLSAIEGTLFAPSEPQPPGTVPLMSWLSDDFRYNRATTDTSWASERPGRRRVEGYVYDPSAAQPPGSRPLFTWYNAERDDYFTTAQAHWCTPIGVKVRCPSGRENEGATREGYQLVRLEGFVH